MFSQQMQRIQDHRKGEKIAFRFLRCQELAATAKVACLFRPTHDGADFDLTYVIHVKDRLITEAAVGDGSEK